MYWLALQLGLCHFFEERPAVEGPESPQELIVVADAPQAVLCSWGSTRPKRSCHGATPEFFLCERGGQPGECSATKHAELGCHS